MQFVCNVFRSRARSVSNNGNRRWSWRKSLRKVFPFSLALSSNSDAPNLDPEACSAISSDPNKLLMLATSSSEELDVDVVVVASIDPLPQSYAYEELLEVVTHAVAKLNLDCPEEKQEVAHSKLDKHFFLISTPRCRDHGKTPIQPTYSILYGAVSWKQSLALSWRGPACLSEGSECQ